MNINGSIKDNHVVGGGCYKLYSMCGVFLPQNAKNFAVIERMASEFNETCLCQYNKNVTKNYYHRHRLTEYTLSAFGPVLIISEWLTHTTHDISSFSHTAINRADRGQIIRSISEWWLPNKKEQIPSIFTVLLSYFWKIILATQLVLLRSSQLHYKLHINILLHAQYFL